MSEIKNMYLLLRDNKQTGPHSFEEMLKLGFRKYDLVWVEGKSAAWRYPGEVSEFKEFAPLVEEQPFDRFYKKSVSSERKAVSAVQEIVDRPQEAVSSEPVADIRQKTIEKEPSESAEGLTHEEVEKRRSALVENKQKQDNPKYLPKEKNEPVAAERRTRWDEHQINTEEGIAQTAERHRKVAITMPADLKKDYIFPPQPRKQEPEPRFIPVSTAAPFAELMSYDAPPISKAETRSGSYHRDYTPYLQFAGIAAALISLLMVGILIGMGISTDTPTPVPVISEQPSRITELKKKLSLTEAVTPVVSVSESIPEEEQTEDAGVVNTRVKRKPVSAKEATPVSASYPTSDAPPPVAHDKKREKEAVQPESNASINMAENIILSLNKYKVNVFGGIDGIEVTVWNSADIPVEEVVVELRYILSNKNKKHLTETIKFRDLKPGETKTLPGPKSNRGIKLESYVVSAR